MAGWHRFVVLRLDSDIPNDVIFGSDKGAEHPLNGGARGEWCQKNGADSVAPRGARVETCRYA
jgi:hypothetical protein